MAEQIVNLDSNDETESLQAIIDSIPDGDGITFTGSVNVRMVTIKGRKNVTYRNLNLVSTSLPTQSVPNHDRCVVLIENCENITIENIKLDGKRFPAIGIGIVKSKGTRIIGGEIFNLGNFAGGAIQGYGDFDTIIDGIKIHDVANVDGHSRGIWMGNVHENGLAFSTRPIIRNCIIQRTGTPGDGTGIAGHVIGVTVEDCYVTDTGGAGTKFGDGSRDIIVRRTTCLRNDFFGLQLSRANVVNALIEDCTFSNNLHSGIMLWGAENVTLRRCFGTGNLHYGWISEGELKNFQIVDCHFPNNGRGFEGKIVK